MRESWQVTPSQGSLAALFRRLGAGGEVRAMPEPLQSLHAVGPQLGGDIGQLIGRRYRRAGAVSVDDHVAFGMWLGVDGHRLARGHPDPADGGAATLAGRGPCLHGCRTLPRALLRSPKSLARSGCSSGAILQSASIATEDSR